MTPSIRKVLLINLLLTITITTTLTAFGNYFLGQKDIEHHLDSLLTQVTLTFQALIAHDTGKRDLTKLQAYLDNLKPRAIKIFGSINEDRSNHSYKEKFQFQLWNKSGKLLLHSPNAPLVPLSDGHEGFTQKNIDDRPWRVFTSLNHETGMTIVVAERYDIRADLAHKIARDDAYIMLLIYPLLGLLIWVVIGRGLSSIKRVTNEIKQREPNYLEAVDLEQVPDEIKALIDELNHLLVRLKQGLVREKRFTDDAAHELRTPLAALKTHVQIALKKKTLKDKEQSLRLILKGVDRATHITQQLLTLSRMHPDVAALESTEKVNLLTLTKEVVATLIPSALEKHIDVELNCKSTKLSVDGNEAALSILIRNIVDNAIRYTPEAGLVNINLSETKDSIMLEVVDNGPGIPEALRGRIFERFFRVLGTNVSGSGLGLAIVSQIVHLHQAKIELDDGPEGVGLSFKIIFHKFTD